MAKKARIHAKCDECGDFEVVRRRTKRTATSGEVYDMPKRVVCPKCKQWGTITKIEEV